MSRYARGLALEAIEASADKIALTSLDAENTLPHSSEIERTAERWAEQDVVALVIYNEPLVVQKRRQHLAGCLLAARAARAGDLADMAFAEAPRFGVDKRRQTHRNIRRLCHAYEAALDRWTRKLRAGVKALKPAPIAPEPRMEPPPRGPFEVHPDHLAARLLDIFDVRAVIAAGEKRVEATWTQPVNAAKLRGELAFILAPARVLVATPTRVVLEWD